MKLTRLLSFALSVTMSVFALATPSWGAKSAPGFGLGVIIGSPTGLSGKYTLSRDRAIDAALGWDGSSSTHFTMSHLWMQQRLFSVERESVDLFYGVGGSLRTNSSHADNRTLFAVRAPVGLSIFFAKPRLEPFFQLALNLGLVPSSSVFFDAGIGVRYIF